MAIGQVARSRAQIKRGRGDAEKVVTIGGCRGLRAPQDPKLGGVLIPPVVVFKRHPTTQSFYADSAIMSDVVGALMQGGFSTFTAAGISRFHFYQEFRYRREYESMDFIHRRQSILIPDRYVNQCGEVQRLILAPIFDELGVDQSGGGFSIQPGRQDKLLVQQSLNLSNISEFLLAIERRSASTFDVIKARELLLRLQTQLRGTRSLAHVDLLLSAFRAYKPIRLSGFTAKARDPYAQADMFYDLLDHKSYQSMSYEGGLFGCKDHTRRALLKFRLIQKDLFRSRAFQFLYDKTLRHVSVPLLTHFGISGKSLPKSGDLSAAYDALFGPRFLPPIIDLSLELKAARKRYSRRFDLSGADMRIMSDEEAARVEEETAADRRTRSLRATGRRSG